MCLKILQIYWFMKVKRILKEVTSIAMDFIQNDAENSSVRNFFQRQSSYHWLIKQKKKTATFHP